MNRVIFEVLHRWRLYAEEAWHLWMQVGENMFEFLKGIKIQNLVVQYRSIPGVPISEAVAGVACGLVTSSDDNIGQYKLITDILVIFDIIGNLYQPLIS
jgi:hypothetical protein